MIIDPRHVSFCFGRFQPPHYGHRLLMQEVMSHGSNFRIFASPSWDKKTNPIEFETKVDLIKRMFPEIASGVNTDRTINTVLKAAARLHQHGFKRATFVAGTDRINGFKELLLKYNGCMSAHGFYDLDFEFVKFNSPAIRSTEIRQAVAENNFDKFCTLTNFNDFSTELFNEVKKGLSIR